jgi:hypothetical protein
MNIIENELKLLNLDPIINHFKIKKIIGYEFFTLASLAL